MSFSEPTIKNPATAIIEFKGDAGIFQYYDKEKKEAITIPLPFYFIVLDELSCISGYCEKTKSGIHSNEVHWIKTETLDVRTYMGGEGASGLYKDISDRIKILGGKYCKSVYAMLIQEGPPEIVNFQFKGAAFSAWLDKKIDVQKFAVGIIEIMPAQKGNINYFMPTFEAFEITQQQRELALTLDRQLQVYLRAHKSQQVEAEVKEQTIDVEQQIRDGIFEEVPGNQDVEEAEQQIQDVSDNPDGLPF